MDEERKLFGEKIGEAVITSSGRGYNECNVSDFVSILIANGYGVFITRPSREKYIVKYYRSPLGEF